MTYLVEIVIGFVITQIWCLALAKGGLGRFFLDSPNARSSHTRPVPRGGGALFFLAIGVGLYLTTHLSQTEFNWMAWLILLSFIMVAAAGIWDDVHPLRAKTRLLMQGAAVGLVAISSLAYFPNIWQSQPILSVVYAVVTMTFMLAVVNFFNFADGINGYIGLSTTFGVAILIGFRFFYPEENLLINLNPWYDSMFLLLGSVAAFLHYNMIKGEVFMGDGGSTTLGLFFSVVFLVLFFGLMDQTIQEEVLTAGMFGENYVVAMLLSLSLFVWIFFDCAAMVIAKWMCKVPLSKPHNQHFYQRLSRRFSSHIQTTFALTLTQAAVAILVFYLYFHFEKEVFLFLVAVFYLLLLSGLTVYHRRQLKRTSL